MASTIWLARHGNREDFVDPDWRARAARPFDPPLSEDGVNQARQLARRLQQVGIGHIVASPFIRTVQTAHEVAELCDLPIFVEPGLSEWNNEDWFDQSPEPYSATELRSRFPRVSADHPPFHFPAFPETGDEAIERAGRTGAHLASVFPGALLVIGHGVSVAGIVQTLAPGDERIQCALCALYKLVREGDAWRMELSGDVSHLDRAQAADRLF